jgi:hypothetical protein
MAFHHSPKIITDGLVLTLDASNPKSYPGSGTIWSDLSINRNTGTLISGPTFDSLNNGSIVFDGTDDYVEISNSIGITRDQNKSAFFWINVSSVDTNSTFDRLFIHKPNSTDHFVLTITGQEASAGNFKLAGTPNNNIVKGRTTLEYPINQWCYVGFTWDGTNYIGYHNGVGTIFGSYSGNFLVGSALPDGIYIGTRGDAVTYFNGKLSIVHVYNRTLNGEEVLQNFNSFKKRYNI